jgi:hypothetical protein
MPFHFSNAIAAAAKTLATSITPIKTSIMVFILNRAEKISYRHPRQCPRDAQKEKKHNRRYA